MNQNLPIILIEVVLVFGGTLAFAWWQLRELKKLRQEREAQATRNAPADQSDSAPPASSPESSPGNEQRQDKQAARN